MSRAPRPPVYELFGGKGGTGKTTIACATAIAAADAGKRVLLVSVDPAHSLADALGVPLGARPRPVRGVPRLDAAELDAPAAFRRWLTVNRGRIEELAVRATVLDEEDLSLLLDRSIPGIDELIALIEIDRLGRRHDRVIVDMAPTAHTLSLLRSPATLAALARVLGAMHERERIVAGALGGAALDDGAGGELVERLGGQAASLAALLRDGERSAVRWVVLPEAAAVAEAVRGIQALARDGIRVTEIVVNRVTPAAGGRGPGHETRRGVEATALCGLRDGAPGVPIRLVSDRPREPRGAAALRRLARSRQPALARGTRSARAATRRGGAAGRAPHELLDVPRGLRLLLVMGKGGVGKSTCACALALSLASMPRRVRLLSADPAHSLGDLLGVALGDDPRPVPGAPAGLTARELDPAAGFARRREAYDSAVGALAGGMGGFLPDRRILREVLEVTPPGLDELVALLEVTSALGVDGGRGRAPGRRRSTGLVVVDMAPSGHALRLLDLAAIVEGWAHDLMKLLLKYRGVARVETAGEELLRLARRAGGLRRLLADPSETRAVVVTRPAELVAAETARLLAALRRREVAVAGVVTNALALAGQGWPPPVVGEQARIVGALARRARRILQSPCAMIVAPLEAAPPAGVARLCAWSRRWSRADAR
jgi:arsenite-transporting ATPase